MLGEMSQTKTNTMKYHLFVESKKKEKKNPNEQNKTKQKQLHRYREQTSGHQRWREDGQNP